MVAENMFTPRTKFGLADSFEITKSLQQFEIPDLLHMCAPCSEIPSNICTMLKTEMQQILTSIQSTDMNSQGTWGMDYCIILW